MSATVEVAEEKKLKNKSLVWILLLVSILMLMPYGAAIAAGWHWFITPLGVPSITPWQGVGIALLFRLVVPWSGKDRTTDDEYYWAITGAVAGPLFYSLALLIVAHLAGLA